MKRLVLGFVIAIGALSPAHAREGLSSLNANLDSLRNALRSGILQTTAAKEICSCRYVSGISLPTCLTRTGLPQEALDYIQVSDRPGESVVQVYPVYKAANVGLTLFAAEARFNKKEPRKGCRVTYGYLEALENGQAK